MTAPTVDVLIFVEDPGAANFVAELPEALSQRGISVELLAAGTAVNYLCDRGLASRAVPSGTDAQTLLSEYRPRLFLAGTAENPESLGLHLIDCCREHGIPTIGAVDMSVNAPRRFCGTSSSALAHAPDWLLVGDLVTRQAFEALGYPTEHMCVSGHPHQDYIYSERRRLAAADLSELRKQVLPDYRGQEPVLVFLSEPVSILDPSLSRRGPDYTLSGRGGSELRTHIALEELLDASRRLHLDPLTVVRLHPKNRPEEFAAYLDEVAGFSSGGNALELLWAADLVVGMTSMLLQEAFVLGARCLSILPRPGDRSWLSVLESGLIECATTRPEIEHHLRSALAAPCPRLPDAVPSEFFPPGALERAVNFVQEHLLHTSCEST